MQLLTSTQLYFHCLIILLICLITIFGNILLLQLVTLFDYNWLLCLITMSDCYRLYFHCMSSLCSAVQLQRLVHTTHAIAKWCYLYPIHSICILLYLYYSIFVSYCSCNLSYRYCMYPILFSFVFYVFYPIVFDLYPFVFVFYCIYILLSYLYPFCVIGFISTAIRNGFFVSTSQNITEIRNISHVNCFYFFHRRKTLFPPFHFSCSKSFSMVYNTASNACHIFS